jgi:hypothetical protein
MRCREAAMPRDEQLTFRHVSAVFSKELSCKSEGHAEFADYLLENGADSYEEQGVRLEGEGWPANRSSGRKWKVHLRSRTT